jgi:hypothetical protein
MDRIVMVRSSTEWQIAEYPSLRFYDPVCVKDAVSGIVICSELDGQHISATKEGRQLWRKDSVRDWHIGPYRTAYPVVVSIGRVEREPAQGTLGNGSTVVVTYDSSQFGRCAIESGEFRFLGQN